MKKIVSSVLSQVLSRYIDHIDESQLEIELWNGKCQLENVKIAENALSSHYIPLIVQKGVLDKINLIFPWSRLKSEPCEINIENIFILATINGTTLIYKDLSSKNKSKSLEALDSSMESGSSLTAFNSIIDNLRVNLKNIHLRIEIPIKDHYIALGIMFSNISYILLMNITNYISLQTLLQQFIKEQKLKILQFILILKHLLFVVTISLT